MKREYQKLELEVERFVPNEYVAVCEGMIEDENGNPIWIVFGSDVRKEIAYDRQPDEIGDGNVMDDIIDWANPKKIYLGSFYRQDGTLIIPDATGGGHEFVEDWGPNPCVRGDASKSPWGYHYHFLEVKNNS